MPPPLSLSVVLADPSAPSMGSTNTVTTNFSDSNVDNHLTTQSPVAHDSSYPPSPSTSTGYNYHNNSLPMSARSVNAISENQHPISPKAAFAPSQPPAQSTPPPPQQHRQQEQPIASSSPQPSSYTQSPAKTSMPKQQPIAKASPPPQIGIQSGNTIGFCPEYDLTLHLKHLAKIFTTGTMPLKQHSSNNVMIVKKEIVLEKPSENVTEWRDKLKRKSSVKRRLRRFRKRWQSRLL